MTSVYQKWKRIGNPNTESNNIQPRYRNGIWYRKMRHASNEKQEMTNNRRKWTTKSRKIQNALRKGNLQVLENIGSDPIKKVEMKEKNQKRVSQENHTKLHSRNLIKGINTWAVPLVRYSGPFLKLTREELKQMDQRAKKKKKPPKKHLMTIHKTMYPRDDVDRLYVSRKEGGRGLTSIEDNVDTSIQRLEDYIGRLITTTNHYEGRLITTTRNNTDDTRTNRPENLKTKWEEK